MATLAMGSAAFATNDPVPAQVVGQVQGYSPDVANEEGYWYSRYSMMTLTMQSGLGVSIPMDQRFMSMMQRMIASVGAAPNDPVMPPRNPALLQVIYAEGDPHYATAPDQLDFGTLRWVGGQPKLTTAATANTITKELEWAKLFHRDEHFGQAGIDSFGSTQRFVGVMLAAMAKIQLQTYFAHFGAYGHSKTGEYALLTALSDATGVYSAVDQANNQGPNAAPPSYPAENRYADPAAAEVFGRLAKAEFSKVLVSRPSSARDLSLAIQSVVWYASISKDPNELADAKAAVIAWGDRLRESDDDDPAGLAYQVRGLIEVGRTTGRHTYLMSAAQAFNNMTADFDVVHGVLHGSDTLSIDDVAEIAGAFNASKLWLRGWIDQIEAANLFGAWWEGTVNLSGLEISSPGIKQMKGAYELLDPPGRGTTPQNVLNYRYPTVPLPEMAGGIYGVAPVFAASVNWDADSETWQADEHFDTAGAMHAANELIWFHSDEINGFPTVTLP